MFERKLTVGGYEIDAISTGGVETCFQVPAFDLCLDIGRCPPGAERRGTLLLTHAHIDHAAGLPYYVSLRGLNGAFPPRVFCPAASEPALRRLLEVWTTLQADSERCTLTGVGPGDEIPLKRGAIARVFRSPHRISAVGYTVFSQNKKLRPDLVGQPEATIAALARAGEAVSERVETPELCFPGDTLADVIDREPSVTSARVLLLECTFMGTKVAPEKARKGGHVHLEDIAARASAFHNEVVVLTHFSRRYDPDEIRQEVRRRLPAGLRDRLELLLPA